MKNILTLLLLAICVNMQAQFAIVKDSDGFVNIRDQYEVKGKIIDKLENGHVIFLFESDTNWINIEYRKKAENHYGYIYHDRYIAISSFEGLKQISVKRSKIILKNDAIQVAITSSKFDKNKHQLKYAKDQPTVLETIDGKTIWGCDGNVPKMKYEAIEITYNGKTFTLPKKALEGLYEPTIDATKVNFDKKTETLYIQSLNSDGAAGYQVLWKIVKGKYVDHIVLNGF